MADVTEKPFGKVRSFLFPIHGFEMKKIIPLLLMFLCISFNYTILRDLKDSIIVTAPGSGAEIIPFLKVWGVVPMAILFMLLYAKMSNKLSKPKLFYTTITGFLVFFALFATVIYPLKDVLHPTTSADWLQSHAPQGFKGLIAIYRNWSFALFYIMSELWGSAALSLVLWGFVNDITKVTEAKRFYPQLGIGANIALLMSGPLIMYFASIGSKLPKGVDSMGFTINCLMTAVVISGIIAMLTYRWMQKHVMTDPKLYDATQIKGKKKKPSMSMKESFKFLAGSKYLRNLAFLVFAYGVTINLIEVTWKSQLKLAYPNAVDYTHFMGLFSTITGAATIFMMMFVGGNLMRKKGWTFTALVTPVMMLVTGILFFSFVIFKGKLGWITALAGATPLMFAVVLGTFQNIFSKSSKYSMFDPTKEMAYIPLDQESKVKGKAAIDVVGARMGKSGGALIQQVLIIAFGSLAAITPIIAVVVFAIVLKWAFSAKALGKMFNSLNKEQEEAKAKEEAMVIDAQETSTEVAPESEKVTANT